MTSIRAPPMSESGARYKNPQELRDYKSALESRDPQELDRLSRSESVLVKAKVAWNRYTSDETMERLANDSELTIRIQAREAQKFVDLDRAKRKAD